MKDKTYRAIVDALILLKAGNAEKSNGKISGVNLAKEAGISKATLYRYLETNSDLQESYDDLRRHGSSIRDAISTNVTQENRILRQEVIRLRSEMADMRRQLSQLNSLKAHQIHLVWLENKKLKEELLRRTSSSNPNVIPLHPIAPI